MGTLALNPTVIRAAYLGEAPGDLSSLENPLAVEDIRAART